MMYRHFFKPLIGFIGAFLGSIILLLPMLICMLIIRLDSKGPALFKQVRLGKNRKPFTIYKLRTMVNNAYEKGGVASFESDVRITRVGKFLRKTSLDEWPQLINILKGDMSIIGPRPILPIEFEPYEENSRYCRRYDVRPGMFCTVDLDLRATASRETQFEMDADYVDKMSFLLDFKVFFGIIKTIITGKNVYKEQ